MNTLNNDELYTIFSHASNFNVTLTCKKWYNIILKKSNICPTCHKITNIGDTTLWITDKDDPICHGYYDTQQKYTLLKNMMVYNHNYLQMIKRQSSGLCLHAIKTNYKTFKLINSTHLKDRILHDAIKINPQCLKFVEKTTIENYFNAIDINGKCLVYVPEEFKTYELCMRAIKQTPYALEHIKNQTEEMCLEAIKHPMWHRHCNYYINIFTEHLSMKFFELHNELFPIKYEIDIRNI